jgi:very-short-patch-repair endonuclease
MTEKTFNRIRGSTPAIEKAAKQLRKQSTPAEEILWQALRNRQLNGLRFRRQHPVGRFILDFYCPSAKLVIELDGAVHTNQQEYDTIRTHELETYGYRIIRFDNQQVLNDLDAVLDEIYQASLSFSQRWEKGGGG